ncbi:hypothetical protein ACIQ4I_15715 [Rummeliibacillus sp. NPDC094406]|uniref:hypothetical protein n=1 Tax=Rummeliibacillus sp. NPDC094406 TaxID=3364511 RepID=UPI00381BABB3
MRKQFWKSTQNLSQIENGKDISLKEIRIDYNLLIEEMNQLLIEIKEVVDKNDYVKLMILVDRRNQLHAAIRAIESIYDDDDLHQSSFNNIVDEIMKHKKTISHYLQKSSASYTHHFINIMQKTLRSIEKE